MRAEESPRRRKMPDLVVDKRITSKRYREMTPARAVRAFNGEGRLVLTWLPIHKWLLGRVWEQLGTSETDVARRQALYTAGDVERAFEGWPAHPAYVFGNERLSCALCVLASRNDLCNGMRHNPELYQHYVQLEERSGYTFKNGFSLKDLQTE